MRPLELGGLKSECLAEVRFTPKTDIKIVSALNLIDAW
jgi:hypothetical protein